MRPFAGGGSSDVAQSSLPPPMFFLLPDHPPAYVRDHFASLSPPFREVFREKRRGGFTPNGGPPRRRRRCAPLRLVGRVAADRGSRAGGTGGRVSVRPHHIAPRPACAADRGVGPRYGPRRVLPVRTREWEINLMWEGILCGLLHYTLHCSRLLLDTVST